MPTLKEIPVLLAQLAEKRATHEAALDRISATEKGLEAERKELIKAAKAEIAEAEGK